MKAIETKCDNAERSARIEDGIAALLLFAQPAYDRPQVFHVCVDHALGFV
ncbi:hypothetical protein [Bradyrhizobium frederickii]|nr:hypothetical protein [Bradyrhizobium frederickii]